MFFERGIRVSRRRIFLLAGDIIFIVASIILSALIRLAPKDGWEYVLEHIPTLGGSTLIFLLVFYAGGMYEQQAVRSKSASVVLPLITTAIGLAIIIMVFYARYKLHIGRGILLLAALFIFLFAWMLRRLYRIAVGYGLFMKNTLVVGEGRDVEAIIHLLNNTEDAGYKIFGIVACVRTRAEAFIGGIPILGYVDRLREFADVYSIETLIIATSPARSRKLLRVLRPLRYSGVEVLDYVALCEEIAQEIPLEHINDEWLMRAAMNSSVVHIRKVKRVMDVAVAAIGLMVSLPISLLAALLVKLESRGPVFYTQQRAGLDGRPYTLIKFRTMRRDAEAQSGAVWAMRHDTRVTRIGRFLRKWRIDEIPQLINVLKGDMSLVGPRPERPEFIATLAEAIPFYKERLLVPPGITGWAQVKFPYASSIEGARRKLQYDLYYIKNMSFFLDCLILLRTFKTIIVGLKYGEDGGETEEEPPAGRVLPLPPGDEKTRGAASA